MREIRDIEDVEEINGKRHSFKTKFQKLKTKVFYVVFVFTILFSFIILYFFTPLFFSPI